MKKNAIRSVKQLTLFLLLLSLGYSCSDDNDPVIDFNETQWKIVNVTVNKADWQWMEVDGRYAAVLDLPELTKFIYENGAQLSYVFIGQQGTDEVQKLLPFVHTYSANVGGEIITYTETISCDFQLDTPSNVAFYIQASDLARDDSILANYNFRIVLIS